MIFVSATEYVFCDVETEFLYIIYASNSWVDNIKMDLNEIGWDGMVWTASIWFGIGTSGGLL
jgi:hypothetical protein